MVEKEEKWWATMAMTRFLPTCCLLLVAFNMVERGGGKVAGNDGY